MQLPKNRYAPFVLRRCLCALTFFYSTVTIQVEGQALNLRFIGMPSRDANMLRDRPSTYGDIECIERVGETSRSRCNAAC